MTVAPHQNEDNMADLCTLFGTTASYVIRHCVTITWIVFLRTATGGVYRRQRGGKGGYEAVEPARHAEGVSTWLVPPPIGTLSIVGMENE